VLQARRGGKSRTPCSFSFLAIFDKPLEWTASMPPVLS
jgi:hypothetical protein